MATVSMSSALPPSNSNKRAQLEALIRKFQSKLGGDWEKYHESVALFLVGKLSRQELVQIVGPLLRNGLVRYHNRLLLLNFANLLHDTPAEFSSELALFWSKKNSKVKNVKLSQYEKFKHNIMGLPLKERRRIRSITKDSGKRNKLNAFITLTRHAMLPKIPMLQDKEQQQLQVNNLVQWQQDVVTGINTPLALALHELPDAELLLRRVVMTMREHGLVGGVSPRVLSILSLGLEAHMKNIIECAIDTVRYRASKHENTLLGEALVLGERKRVLGEREPVRQADVVIAAEDINNTLEMYPHLIEPCGPRVRLASVMLQNDDLVDHEWPGYTLPARPVEHDDKRPPTEQGSPDELKWVLHDLIKSM